VADPVPVPVGRPLTVLLLAGCLLVVGVLAYGGIAFFHHRHAAAREQAVAEVTRGATLLIGAEGGHAGACRKAVSVLAGPTADMLRDCRALVDHDPGARADRVRVDVLRLHGTTGTARVRTSVTDGDGTRSVDRVLRLEHASRGWLWDWDGTPL
jgi:hypothetical protein